MDIQRTAVFHRNLSDTHFGDTAHTLFSLLLQPNMAVRIPSDVIYVKDVVAMYVPNSFSPDGDGINEILNLLDME